MKKTGKIYLVGLGNMGDKYEGTRHNVGFLFLDTLVDDFTKEAAFKSYIAKTILDSREVVCVKPYTFMNNSGEAVSQLRKNDEDMIENMIVIYDDIDLPLGKIRITSQGGSGGHNGIKSIEEHLKTKNFLRIKVGISRVGEDGNAVKPKGGIFTSKAAAVSSFVLKPFTKDEREVLNSVFKKVHSAVLTIINEGELAAMNKYN